MLREAEVTVTLTHQTAAKLSVVEAAIGFQNVHSETFVSPKSFRNWVRV